MNLTLHDKIKGAVFGFALGDALGVGTEFMTRGEVRAYYPNGLQHFNQIIRDAHRSQWQPGEPTTDTLMFTAMLEQIIADGKVNIYNCAGKLKHVVENVEEDLNPVFRIVMGAPGWEENPIQSSHKTWQHNRRLEASCDALQRGIVAALVSTADSLDENTRNLVLLTHDDTRCITSALVIAHTAYSLLYYNVAPSYNDIESLALGHDSRLIPYLQSAKEKSLEELDLDDEETMTYTRKAMSAVLWSLWHCESAEEVLYKIANAGGDADTNAATSCAIAGLKYGFNAFPDDKNQLVNKEYLENLSLRLTEFVEAKITDKIKDYK